uniref:ATP synthase subunit 8 n=2 Tax=Tuberolachnus salignus TaxID=96551 RepID=A0A1L1YMG0_TUBSA|nr:ATP synthase subunit 8 [Tuberolachnus salignus]
MAPINWLILFLFFFTMFYMILNFMYFNYNKNYKLKLLNKIHMKNYNKFI